jgi:hypothetical protein
MADRSLQGARPPVKREYKAIFFEVKGWRGAESDLSFLAATWLARPPGLVRDVFGIPLKLFTYNGRKRFNLHSNCLTHQGPRRIACDD